MKKISLSHFSVAGNTATNYYPELKTAEDINDYIQYLYKVDTPEFPHYKHIFMSLKKRPIYMRPVNLVLSGGKHGLDLYAKEKVGSKREFYLEFTKNYLGVYKKTSPRQKTADYEFVGSYELEDLM